MVTEHCAGACFGVDSSNDYGKPVLMREMKVLDMMLEHADRTGATALLVRDSHPTHYCLCVVDTKHHIYTVLALRKTDTTKEELDQIAQEFLKPGRIMGTFDVPVPVSANSFSLPLSDGDELIDNKNLARRMLVHLGQLQTLERESLRTHGTAMVLHMLHPTHWCICVADIFSFKNPFYFVQTLRKSHFSQAEVEAELKRIADEIVPPLPHPPPSGKKGTTLRMYHAFAESRRKAILGIHQVTREQVAENQKSMKPVAVWNHRDHVN